MGWTTCTSTCASATPRCSHPPSFARRSQPLVSPCTTGLRPTGGGRGRGERRMIMMMMITVGRGKQKKSDCDKVLVWLFSSPAVCRSKRKGYLHYAMGQLRQMGKQFYDTDIHVEVLSEQMVGDYSHVTMRYWALLPQGFHYRSKRLCFFSCAALCRVCRVKDTAAECASSDVTRGKGALLLTC